MITGLTGADIRRLLLPLALWLSTMISALSLVYVTYDMRLKHHQLESLQRQKNHLQIMWGQYLLEESTWAAYNRVEQIAQEQLDMRALTAERIIVVR